MHQIWVRAFYELEVILFADDLPVRYCGQIDSGAGRFARTTVAIAAAASGQARSSWPSSESFNVKIRP
jgi:hypothetical protein